ncbi:MAG TPA: PRC-barrel domain-containing protein [Sporichthyaceae bacterium]|nr:PRC-barrel domain-containing protein [Sporichthyaceae bacterium]
MTAALVHAAALTGLPLVTLGGEREALIKDVVFDRGTGQVAGFTLNNPGLLSRSRKDALPWDAVHGFGDVALTIVDTSVLVPLEEVAPAAERDGADVLAGQVLTDGGTELGTVVDVILDLSARPPDVVGYEIEPGPALPGHGHRVLVPLPATGAVSGERLIVPAAATEFVADDLGVFAVTVQAFRNRPASVTEGQN